MATAAAIPSPRAAHPRLPRWRKVAYGFGDVIVGIRQTAFQFYLMPFYTDVVGLAPSLAGLGKMIGFLWDGLNDPVTGYLSDRTRTRLGRRRPFLFAAALPLGLTFGLVWSPPAHPGPVLGFAYLVLAFALVDTCFTLYATPYLALGAEMSSDYHERTELSAWRALFHVVGLMAGGVIPGMILAHGHETGARFAVMGFALGAFMAVVALLTGALTLERLPERHEPATSPSWSAFFHGFRTTLANRPFRVMVTTFAVVLLAGGLHQTLVPYAFRYWLGRPAQVNGVIAIYLAASVVSLPLWTRLARAIGKDRALKLCMLCSSIALAVLPLALAPDMGNARLGVLLVIAGLGNGGWAVLPVAITADIVDHDELATARRREGSFFGVWTLVMKTANGLASGIVGIGLELVGYVPNETQSAATVLGIKLLYGPVPAVLMLVALLLFRRFPLTRERHREVQSALAARGSR
jgi:GPH family glycoside/pentoside/hexuronide:cation symporter